MTRALGLPVFFGSEDGFGDLGNLYAGAGHNLARAKALLRQYLESCANSGSSPSTPDLVAYAARATAETKTVGRASQRHDETLRLLADQAAHRDKVARERAAQAGRSA